jgi:hypothetical protein
MWTAPSKATALANAADPDLNMSSAVCGLRSASKISTYIL